MRVDRRRIDPGGRRHFYAFERNYFNSASKALYLFLSSTPGAAMKKSLSFLSITLLALCLAAGDASARRLGGGGNIGKQRSTPAMRESPTQAPPAPQNAQQTAKPAQAAPAPATAPAAVAPKPSFMSRWGGLIAGVGLGALLGSMLGGGGFGAGMGGLLNILLIVGVLYLIYRFFMSRRAQAAAPMQFAGATGLPAQPDFRAIDQRIEPAVQPVLGAAEAQSSHAEESADAAAFVRLAQSAFIRLQAANDAKDLADLRSTTTPEVYAELAMQIRERGDAVQQTEVVTIAAQLLETVTEGDEMIASVRFSGLIREAANAPAEPFNEIWHLRKKQGDDQSMWLIAGILQAA